jgi:anti-anti-sigma regulatory factor
MSMPILAVEDGGARWVLHGPLVIETAASVRDALRGGMAGPGPAEVSLDASDVGEAGAAGVQLLVAAARALRAAGRTPRLAGASAPLETVARALGASGTDHCCGWLRG